MKVSHDKLAKNVFPLPDFTMFTTATYSGSARDKFIHSLSFTCKSHEMNGLILNIAMTAETYIRLLEQAFKAAIHYIYIYIYIYIYTHTHTTFVHALLVTIEFFFAWVYIKNLDGKHLKRAMQ